MLLQRLFIVMFRPIKQLEAEARVSKSGLNLAL
jgi:hypothetical protein